MCSELLNGEFGSLVILDRAEVLSLIDVPRSWGDSPQQQQAGKEHVSSRRDQEPGFRSVEGAWSRLHGVLIGEPKVHREQRGEKGAS
jgi:hypothetical protein